MMKSVNVIEFWAEISPNEEEETRRVRIRLAPVISHTSPAKTLRYRAYLVCSFHHLFRKVSIGI
jgi:hypothetical protein